MHTQTGFSTSFSAHKQIAGISPKASSHLLNSEGRNQDQISLVGPTLLAGRKVGATEIKPNVQSAGHSKKELAVSNKPKPANAAFMTSKCNLQI